jgi:ribosomal protein S18 acetylase RimI-like enzyme
MYSILLGDEYGRSRDEVIELLAKAGIETRPLFYPMHIMPVYKKITTANLNISEKISKKGINLPTFYELNKEDIRLITHQLVKFKVDKIRDRHNKEYLVKNVNSEYESKLKSFFEIIKKSKLNRFFHPHSFNYQAVKKIINISESNKKDLYYLVLDQEDQIRGYFMLRGFDEGYKVPSFGEVVHPNFQNRGLGTEILKIAIKISKRLKVKKLMLHVYKNNLVAKKIYKSLGFQFFSSSRTKDEQIGYLKLKQKAF